MSRQCCQQCQRPQTACVCRFTCKINNQVQVIVLQHPKEQGQSKNTVTLLQGSLTKCQVFIGETFQQNTALIELIESFQGNIALLYPSEQAIVLSETAENNCQQTPLAAIIIIDATWKKAYKMYQLNSFLQQMLHLTLPANMPSYYQIRKTSKVNALSSLEACCYALTYLESCPDKYQPLLNNFINFNNFQLSFRKDQPILK